MNGDDGDAGDDDYVNERLWWWFETCNWKGMGLARRRGDMKVRGLKMSNHSSLTLFFLATIGAHISHKYNFWWNIKSRILTCSSLSSAPQCFGQQYVWCRIWGYLSTRICNKNLTWPSYQLGLVEMVQIGLADWTFLERYSFDGDMYLL